MYLILEMRKLASFNSGVENLVSADYMDVYRDGVGNLGSEEFFLDSRQPKELTGNEEVPKLLPFDRSCPLEIVVPHSKWRYHQHYIRNYKIIF